jgi:hypothetical protein
MNSSVQSIEIVERRTVRLELGDWIPLAGLVQPVLISGPELVIRLVRVQHTIAKSMHQQAMGRLIEAEHLLGRAQELAQGPPGAPSILAAPASPGPARLAHRVWLVLERERQDLAQLKSLAGQVDRGRGEIVLACLEHLTWVDFCPYLQRHPPGVPPTTWFVQPSTMNRRDVCLRATILRQLAGERRGDVSGKTWDRMGGDRAVRYLALQALAEEQLSRSKPPADRPPVRLGRLRAWQYARRLQADVLTTDSA